MPALILWLLIALPLAELVFFVVMLFVLSWAQILMLMLWVVVGTALGVWLWQVRIAGIGARLHAQVTDPVQMFELARGGPEGVLQQARQELNGLAIAVLLLIPGALSDGLAMLLLLPPLRQLLWRSLLPTSTLTGPVIVDAEVLEDPSPSPSPSRLASPHILPHDGLPSAPTSRPETDPPRP